MKCYLNPCIRALYHRDDQRGLKIKNFQGIAVLPEEARVWFADHPVALPNKPQATFTQ